MIHISFPLSPPKKSYYRALLNLSTMEMLEGNFQAALKHAEEAGQVWCSNVAKGHVPEAVLLRTDYCVARLHGEKDDEREIPIRFLPKSPVGAITTGGRDKQKAHDRLCRAIRNVKFLDQSTLAMRRNPFIRDGFLTTNLTNVCMICGLEDPTGGGAFKWAPTGYRICQEGSFCALAALEKKPRDRIRQVKRWQPLNSVQVERETYKTQAARGTGGRRQSALMRDRNARRAKAGPGGVAKTKDTTNKVQKPTAMRKMAMAIPSPKKTGGSAMKKSGGAMKKTSSPKSPKRLSPPAGLKIPSLKSFH